MIDDLIHEAEALKDENYDSAPVKLWKRRAKAFVVQAYGDDYLSIFNGLLRFKVVVLGERQGQQQHREALTNAVAFLEGLRREPLLPTVDTDDPPPGLHPAIQKGCVPLFESGHFVEAVEKSFKIVRDRLRELTGYETGSEAFGKGGLRVKGAAAPHVEDDFNEGVKFLTMAIDRFRNEKSHSSDGLISAPDRAREYLSMSSLAMHLLEQAEVGK